MRNTSPQKNTPAREVSLIRLAPSLQILSAVVLFSFAFGISAFLLFVGHELLFNEIKDFLAPDTRNEIEGTIRNLRTISMFGALVPFILFLLWIAVADRTFIRPIADLLRGIEQVAKGNFFVSVKVRGKYGVSALIERFNAMVLRLQAMHKREEEVSRTKGEVVSIVSHQLRTPLSRSKWALSALMEGDAGKLTSEQTDMVKKAFDANGHMNSLITDFLNVTRIEQKRFGYTLKETDINSLINKTVDKFRTMASKRGIALEAVFPKGPITQRVYIDEERIVLALGNFIDNALYYTPSGGSVTVGVVKEKTMLRVSVKDTGIGIPPKDVHRLFTTFFRAPNAIKMRHDGSGLGLFIVKNIITRHGGEAWAESEKGKGSTFFFTLPLKKSAVPKT